ncbi:hypothetical protein L596_018409 [Steinernema carpocapsae]|uniref:F-box domain-containing protein n=1 Tax=Steinernema carpocapsae TaxID=34508 RepID=A0A4V6A253_STECR|nr:hypothetical protein L596_018409 [Steinernema carpocapsae]
MDGVEESVEVNCFSLLPPEVLLRIILTLARRKGSRIWDLRRVSKQFNAAILALLKNNSFLRTWKFGIQEVWLWTHPTGDLDQRWITASRRVAAPIFEPLPFKLQIRFEISCHQAPFNEKHLRLIDRYLHLFHKGCCVDLVFSGELNVSKSNLCKFFRNPFLRYNVKHVKISVRNLSLHHSKAIKRYLHGLPMIESITVTHAHRQVGRMLQGLEQIKEKFSDNADGRKGRSFTFSVENGGEMLSAL